MIRSEMVSKILEWEASDPARRDALKDKLEALSDDKLAQMCRGLAALRSRHAPRASQPNSLAKPFLAEASAGLEQWREAIANWPAAQGGTPKVTAPKAHVVAADSGFMTISFRGKKLGKKTMRFDVFKGLVDNVHSSIRTIFVPVLEAISDGEVSEQAFTRMLSVPVRQPAFNSLTLTIDLPTLDPRAIRRKVNIDFERVTSTFTDACGEFMTQAMEIEALAKESKVYDRFAYSSSRALEVLGQLVPTQNTEFDVLEIVTGITSGTSRRVIVNESEGQHIVDSISRIRQTTENFVGRIVEFNIRSNTFILRRDSDRREVTCYFGSKGIKAAMPAFTHNMTVTVNGVFRERRRRDYLVIESLTLDDGTVIHKDM